jgi:hypothetical protein
MATDATDLAFEGRFTVAEGVADHMPKKTTSSRFTSQRSRSPKAGSPPRESAASPQTRRRQKRASTKLSKGTTLFETDHGPRAAWPASTAKRKKR